MSEVECPKVTSTEGEHGDNGIRLARFSPGEFDRGRGRAVEAMWWIAKVLFIQSNVPWPMGMKRALLRMFGAQVGKGLYIRSRVNIHFPWKLSIGNDVWIGEGTTILNMDRVTIESDVAIAHEVYIAAAGHDIRDPRFKYDNRPIRICRGAWLATRSFVGPGVTVNVGGVVAAGAVAVRDVMAWSVVAGVPAVKIADRVLREEDVSE